MFESKLITSSLQSIARGQYTIMCRTSFFRLKNNPKNLGKTDLDLGSLKNLFNSLTTEKQTTKFSSANFQNMLSISYIENSKTRGQTV